MASHSRALQRVQKNFLTVAGSQCRGIGRIEGFSRIMPRSVPEARCFVVHARKIKYLQIRKGMVFFVAFHPGDNPDPLRRGGGILDGVFPSTIDVLEGNRRIVNGHVSADPSDGV